MARGRKRVEKSDSNASNAKKSAPEPPVSSPQVQNNADQTPEPPQNVISPKHFVMKHIFESVSSLEEEEFCFGPIEDHFGLNLCLSIGRLNGHLGLYLGERNAPRQQWHLNFEGRIRAFGREVEEIVANMAMEDPPLTAFGWKDFSKWESISEFLVDDNLPVEFEICINEMSKIGKRVLRSFDASMEEISDIVLIARNQRFYVSKFTLSSHSQYFKALFSGKYKEANMTEIVLNAVDPFDLQNYLEFLYLQPSINEDTVEGLLLLADQYDTEILKEKCEGFLMRKKSLKKKFNMFLKYNCAMEKIINEIRTYRDYQEVMAGEDTSQMNPKLMSQLLAKSVSFSQ